MCHEASVISNFRFCILYRCAIATQDGRHDHYDRNLAGVDFPLLEGPFKRITWLSIAVFQSIRGFHMITIQSFFH